MKKLPKDDHQQNQPTDNSKKRKESGTGGGLKSIVKIFGFLFITVLSFAVVYFVYSLNEEFQSLRTEFSLIKESQELIEQNIPDELYADHLALMQKQSLEFEIENLELQFQDLEEAVIGEELLSVNEVYTIYEDFQSKLARNDSVGLDVDEFSGKIDEWAIKLIGKEFDELLLDLDEQNTKLDEEYIEYLASLPPPPTASDGYSYSTVTTERGTSHGVYLIKVPFREYRVKTVAAISSDCSDNCATKSLADYINENGAYAGMNGSYACPPDYAECAGKVNSFDFALYDSNDKKWLNKDALTWFKTGMLTFENGQPEFYNKTSEYDGDSVSAGISNFPSLVKDGRVVAHEGDITSYQKVKALRGAVGVGGENIYLAHISNATVEDAAYVMKALGVKHALNLDGGGTAAMYINGGYVIGPGRSLANAIVLVK